MLIYSNSSDMSYFGIFDKFVLNAALPGSMWVNWNKNFFTKPSENH